MPADAHELAVTSPKRSHIHSNESSFSQKESRENTPIPSPRPLKEDKNSTLGKKKRSPKKSAIDALLDVILGRFKRPGTTKRASGGVCAIAPGLLESESTIFSDRPLFVWQGNVDTIEVQDYWTGQIIESNRLLSGTTSWQHSGPSLQPGEVYIWTLKQGGKALVTKEFQVMSQQKREQIIQQQTLERSPNSFDSKKLSDAAYFSKYKFWSDSLTSLHEESDEGRASIIQDRIYALGEQLCNEDEGIELAVESSQ